MLTEIAVSIPPFIAGVDVELDAPTTAAVRDATRAIIALDTGAGVGLGALSGFLLRSESVATSKIEQLHASRDDVAQALAGEQASTQAHQIADAVQSITGLIEVAGTARGITVSALNDAQRQLVAHDPAERAHGGAIRTVQNWIGGSDFSPRDAQYVAPPPAVVGGLVDDLVGFLHEDRPDPIVQAAVAHAQFESIHPYTDGNGRVGRALINGVLRRRNLTTHVVVPVAASMLAEVDRYFALLDGYRDGDVASIVRFVADAARTAAEEAQVSARALAALPGYWRELVRPRAGSAADALINGLSASPVVTIQTAELLTGKARNRVYLALEQLGEAGVLTELTGRARGRVWAAVDVLDEVDRLEDRIGRRVAPAP